MFYIENNNTNPFFNLAFEEYIYSLLNRYKEQFMLLWQNKPAIIIGRFQNTAAEINAEFVEKQGIHVVRRITGGGAVYHDLGNLNYSLIVPNDTDFSFNFHKYTLPIIHVLKGLGVDAEFNSRNDLTICGKKFSGNAQHMDNHRLLHHGTLLFNSDLEVLSRALQVDESKFQSKAAKSVRSRVTNIKPWLPISMTMEEFKLSVIEEMSKTQRIEKYELSDEDFKNIEDLATQKYSTWAWNWGKSPQFTEKKSHRFKAGKVEIYFNVKDGIIISCKIYGDFFGDENIGELEKKLENCQYEEASLKKRLAPIPLNKYFVAIPSEELLNLICAR